MNKTQFNFCRKVIFSLFAFLSLVMAFAIFKTNVKAASSSFYYINVSVGETYAEAGINYHSNIPGSYVMYSTSKTAVESGTKVDVEEKLWSITQLETDPETGFSERYVCRARLTGLSPDTEYFYQIIAGAEKSEVMRFKTGKVTGATSILFLTDTQSGSKSAFAKINPLIQAIEAKEQNLNMVFMTGDIVDRGGYESQWQGFFEGLTALSNYQFATVPGNHEYYHSNDSAYIDSSIYNQFFFNPQNGPADRLNSSYYFVYGETLYIMLDVMPGAKEAYDLEAHKAWFKKAVQDNPTRWIVVGSHAGAISAGIYASNAKTIWNNWHETFEECQVDLALSGHEHIYIRKDTFYQGEKNEELGVTYLVGPAAGPKDYAVQNTEGLDQTLRGNYRGQVIKTQGSKMTVTLYDQTGMVFASFELSAKRNGAVSEISDQEILDSVSYEYNKDASELTISWTSEIWGLVKEVNCTGDRTWSKNVVSCSPSFASQKMSGVLDVKNYKYNINFVKKDGTVLTKELSVILNENLLPNSITVSGENKINVGDTTQLSVVVAPEGCDQEVTFNSRNPEIATVDENGLVTAVSAGRARIEVISKVKPTVMRIYTVNVVATSNPETLEIVGLPEKYELNGEYVLSASVTPLDASKDVTWSSSDETIAYFAKDELCIVGYGTVTITATSKVVATLSKSVTFTVSKPIEKIELALANQTIKVGDTTTLTVTITPNDTDADVVYVVDNKDVVSIENNQVKGLKEGSAKIKVTSKDNSEIFAEITITVEKVEPITPPVKDKKGCGCKKNMAEVILTLSTCALLLGVLLKKKH